MAAKLKKGDKVVVLTGKDRGRTGEIISVDPSAGKAKVSGLNLAMKHVKRSQTSQGGRLPQEAAIQLSNLAMADPKDGSPTRVGFRMEGDKKVRYAKKSGEVING